MEVPTEALTTAALLAQGEKMLSAAGLAQARREARRLLAAVLSMQPAHLVLHQHLQVTPSQAQAYYDAVARRRRREPWQYIVGLTEFYSLELAVTPAVLIPRPDTEILVRTALGLLADSIAPRLADLGTGSGAIAVALAHHCPGATVAAVDISEDALAVARANARRHALQGRISFYRGSWGEPLLSCGQQSSFALLAANPPYIKPSELSRLQPEVRDFEPRQALLTEEGDPLAPFRVISQDAALLLKGGGWLLLESAPWQAQPLAQWLAGGGWCDIQVVKDYGRRPRLVRARRWH